MAGKLAKDKKAQELVVLDLRKISNFCDYFLICSGSSERHVEAIADTIEEGFAQEKIKLHHPSSKRYGAWTLLDYGDVVVHIFSGETRQYYDLERLWSDAPRAKLAA